jgi:hypothetical protein
MNLDRERLIHHFECKGTCRGGYREVKWGEEGLGVEDKKKYHAGIKR